MPLLLVVAACTSSDGTDTHLGESGGGGDSAHDSAPPAPVDVDVLVIGSGPAGSAAAWSAAGEGASVAVLEMQEEPGGGGNVTNFWAVGTRWQEEQGYPDSAAEALSDWSALTGGGDASDPLVEHYVESSAELLHWLADDFGVEVTGLTFELVHDTTPRVHMISVPPWPSRMLLETLDDDAVRVSTRADELVVEDGRVVGATYTDLESGETGSLRAGAVVVATGGFGRNVDRLIWDRASLEGVEVLMETGEFALGLGLDMVEAAGGAYQNRGQFGLYTHGVPHPDEGYEGEALVLNNLYHLSIVDGSGARVATEVEVLSYELIDLLLASEDKRLFAVAEEADYLNLLVSDPAAGAGATREPEELLELGLATRADSLAELADALGIDADGLLATADAMTAYAADGKDLDFGKTGRFLNPLETGPFYGVQLRPGAAKGFGGLVLDADGRVLDLAGEAIPGLYAAGEVVGMLGTPEIGHGFDGTITACYLGGLTAGRSAAAAASP